MKKLPLYLSILVVLIGVGLRISMFRESGNDFQVYINAVSDFSHRINPYENTIASFSNPERIYDHGFSYLPGFIYLYLPFYLISKTPEEFIILCKIPVLLADIGICILLFRELSKHSKWAAFFSVAIWIFNPYFVSKINYVYMDPIPIFFMLLALTYLGEKEILSAVFYSLSCIFKTFPIILLPIFLIKTKDKVKFIIWNAIPLLIISTPFLYDPLKYLRSTLLVHSDRAVQGKPFLYLISYKLKIEIIRVIPLKVYTYLATFGGWLFVIANELLKKIKKGLMFESKYIYSSLAFLVFYLFTPVLNKTYLLWGMPVAILAFFDLTKEKKWPKWTFYAITAGFYIFYLIYLLNWNYGLHVDYKYY